MPSSKLKIETVIIYGSNARECEASCGVNWSLAENKGLADQRVKDRFGNGVSLRFLDLSQPLTDEFARKWQSRVKNQELPLPLLVIDDQVRIAGEFDMRKLFDAIATEIEIKA